MELQNITYEVEEGIAIITIDRPKALNALNSDTIAELTACADMVADDDSVKGVIVTGSGSKSFVAGADISELATKDALTGRDFVTAGQKALNKLEQLPKPVIAAVNGFALGGGCELAMACHIRVASPNAKFGQPEVGLGLIPGYGGTQRLPRLVGKGIALELLLGGGIINANEAHRIGLVNKVIEAYKQDVDGNDLLDDKGRKIFDKDAFIAETRKFLHSILSKAPLAVGYCIQAVNRGLEHDLAEGLALEADLFGLACATEDMKEGTTAFIEKRGPEFHGK